MSNWYENLTDEQLDVFRYNKVPIGLCEERYAQIFFQIPFEDLLVFEGERWMVPPSYNSMYKSNTYRLRPDWQRPETKWSAILEDAKKKVYQQGRWKECDLHSEGHASGLQECCFHYNGVCLGLSRAFSMVGFGGIQFEGDSIFWIKTFPEQYADERPRAPKKVRFWVGG